MREYNGPEQKQNGFEPNTTLTYTHICDYFICDICSLWVHVHMHIHQHVRVNEHAYDAYTPLYPRTFSTPAAACRATSSSRTYSARATMPRTCTALSDRRASSAPARRLPMSTSAPNQLCTCNHVVHVQSTFRSPRLLRASRRPPTSTSAPNQLSTCNHISQVLPTTPSDFPDTPQTVPR